MENVQGETGPKGDHLIQVFAPLLGPALLAFLGTSLVLGRLDLSDLPGPASGQLISSIALMDEGRPMNPVSSALAAWVDLSPLPLLADLRLLLGPLVSLGATLGASLAGMALAGGGALGRRAAWACGLAMACCSALVEASTWIALEPLAIGLAVLGLGVAMAACSANARWLPLVVPGVAAVLLAGELREVGLPFRALLPVLPLLAWRRPLRALLLALGVVLSLSLGPEWVAVWAGGDEGGSRHTHSPPLSLRAAGVGLGELFGMLYQPLAGRCSLYLPLTALALPAALWPGPRWLARLGFAVLGALATGLTVEALDPGWLRLRYLAVTTTGLVLLSGLTAAGLSAWMGRRPWLALLPSLALAGLLAIDSLDALWTSARERTPFTGISLPRLPEPRGLRFVLNGRAMGTSPHALAVDRAVDLWQVAASTGRPVAATILQDERGAQVVAVAALMGSPSLLLRAEQCCTSAQSSEECAGELLDDLDSAGMDLILPRPAGTDWRFSSQDPLAPRLRALAIERGLPLDGGLSWTRVQGLGQRQGEEPPCQTRLPRLRDPRPTPVEIQRGRWWTVPR